MATELTHALQLDLLSISDRSRRTCRCIWTLKHTQKPSSHVWRAHIGKELPTSKSISLSRNSMLFTIPFSQWSSGRCFHVSYGLSILQIYFYSSWEKQLNKKKQTQTFPGFYKSVVIPIPLTSQYVTCFKPYEIAHNFTIENSGKSFKVTVLHKINIFMLV